MNKRLMIKQLDKQLRAWQAVSAKFNIASKGWVKTLRVALNMSAEQLAIRLGVTRSRITQLENAEIDGAVTLHTLKKAADALGCELVYAIVPKGNDSLESIIKKQARKIAKERILSVAHSMALEAQSVDANILKTQEEELVKELVENLSKKFWTDISTHLDKKNKHKKLIETLKKKK